MTEERNQATPKNAKEKTVAPDCCCIQQICIQLLYTDVVVYSKYVYIIPMLCTKLRALTHWNP